MSRVASLLLLAAIGLGSPSPLAGQADSATRSRRPPIIRPLEFLFIGEAIVIAGVLDGSIRDRAQSERSAGTNEVAAIGNAFGDLRYAGPVLAAGWLTGRLIGSRDLMGATAKATAAGTLAGGITAVIKVGVGRVRPRDGGDPARFEPFSRNVAFPSGHTTLAMALATSLAHSTPDRWTDLAFYGAAALTGYARINDDKHWLSDVIAGAAIGYLVGRQIHQGCGIRPLAGPGAAGLSVSF